MVIWKHLRHFYEEAGPILKERFIFKGLAGIYTENGEPRPFAVCVKYENISQLKHLLAGNYLCADCTEEKRQDRGKIKYRFTYICREIGIYIKQRVTIEKLSRCRVGAEAPICLSAARRRRENPAKQDSFLCFRAFWTGFYMRQCPGATVGLSNVPVRKFG